MGSDKNDVTYTAYESFTAEIKCVSFARLNILYTKQTETFTSFGGVFGGLHFCHSTRRLNFDVYCSRNASSGTIISQEAAAVIDGNHCYFYSLGGSGCHNLRLLCPVTGKHTSN